MALQKLAEENSGDALEQFAAMAAQNKVGGLHYAGDVSARAAFDFMQRHASVLVDVRTLPEWQFTGTPALSQTPSELLTISWKLYPSFAQNPQFADQLAAAPAVTRTSPLFFLCRSGGRSLDAAVAMTAQGYRYCFNITAGFEGDPDTHGHRGTTQGWKAASLPWAQG